MKIRPLRNQLLVRRDASDQKSPGGLYIPDKAQQKSHRGTVVAAGPGYRNEHGVFLENSVKEGAVVLWASGAGVEVIVDGETLVIISEDIAIAEVEAD